MMRSRFPISALVPFAMGGALAVLAPIAAAQDARIDDIEISRDGDKVSILVKLSEQPSAASASGVSNVLTVEIDGVALSALAFNPPAGLLVRQIAATPSGLNGSKLKLEGAAFGPASTTIYRNAVLIETTLAEATLPAAASLMTAAPPAPVAPPAPREPHPSQIMPAAVHEPVKPKPAPPAVAIPGASVAALVKLDAADCMSAAIEIEKDPWALTALGDHALCLLDAGKTPEARNRIEQLAAFSPEDWRVALGRAALSAHDGDANGAESGYRIAAELAPDQPTRDAIQHRIASLRPADH